jgi:outer membrane protein
MKTKGIVTIVVLSLLFKQGVAQGDTKSYNFTVQQAVDFAYQNQSKIKNAALDEQISKARMKEINAIALPQVSGSVDVKDYIELPTSLLPGQFFGGPPGSFIPVKFGVKYNATAGLSASEILFDGSYLISADATRLVNELSRQSTSRTKIDVAASVKKAYYAVLIGDERMKLMNANVERIKKLSEDTKALNANGFVEKIDLDRITLTYNNLLVEKEKIQRFLDLGMNLLKFQMGMDQTATLTLADKLSDVNFQASDVSAEKTDYKKRIEYSLVESQKRGNELDLKRKQYAYFPTVAAYASAVANAQRNDFDFFDTKKSWYPIGIVGATINVPIFSGFQKQYRIQQAKLTLLKSENDLKGMEQVIDLDVANARTALQNTTQSLDMQKKNMELAEEVFRVSKIKYDQGVGSNLEVMSAETSLKESQTNYYSALYDAVIARIDYDKATGNIK